MNPINKHERIPISVGKNLSVFIILRTYPDYNIIDGLVSEHEQEQVLQTEGLTMQSICVTVCNFSSVSKTKASQNQSATKDPLE